jgi:flavodoxin long chain
MQPRIGLFYGSTNGATASLAHRIQAQLSLQTGLGVDVLDVAEFYLEDMLDYDLLIVGVPTWNTGQLQRDWEAVVDEFDGMDLKGRVAALFGLGDQVGYPETFGDALFFVADKLRACGATLVGAWPVAGYTFSGSWAMIEHEAGRRFVGLMLDEDNQADLSDARVAAWLSQVWQEYQDTQSRDYGKQHI